MLTLANTTVMNFENAIRGARNPMNSWEKGDSGYDAAGAFVFGKNDLALAQKLCVAGSDHRKFMRQIFVSVDICAPLYWWKEYDTYKVGTVANSTSTMHRLHSRPITQDDFSRDHMTPDTLAILDAVIKKLEELRLKYNETEDKNYWWDMIQLLPESYQQLRTCTMNYETLIGIFHARKAHKLDEWHVFCDWIRSLPYARELITGE